MKTKVDVQMRELVRENKSVQEITRYIDQVSKQLPATVPLTAVSSCLAESYGNYDLWTKSKEYYDEVIAACYKLPELIFVSLLLKTKIIIGDLDQNNDVNLSVRIRKVDGKSMQELMTFVNELKYVIWHGLFSLNTLTGTAYCADHMYSMKPGSGKYNLLKEFMSTDKPYISFIDVLKIQSGNSNVDSDDDRIKEQAKICIQQIKDDLGMIKGLGKLIKMYEKLGYTLLPHL